MNDKVELIVSAEDLNKIELSTDDQRRQKRNKQKARRRMLRDSGKNSGFAQRKQPRKQR